MYFEIACDGRFKVFTHSFYTYVGYCTPTTTVTDWIFDRQEGNGEIRLNDRDPMLVRKMLEFLYTGDYTYEASNARGSSNENISGELSHTCLDKDLQADIQG
jgi:hypothetical protein